MGCPMPMMGREGWDSDFVFEGWWQYSGDIVEYGHPYSAIEDTQRTCIFDFAWVHKPCKFKYTWRACHVNLNIHGTGNMYIRE